MKIIIKFYSISIVLYLFPSYYAIPNLQLKSPINQFNVHYLCYNGKYQKFVCCEKQSRYLIL